MSTSLPFGTRLTRAAVIGFATIFASKPREQQHWSEPPTALVRREDAESERGEPPADPVPASLIKQIDDDPA